jgi:uncharacterized protein (TIGR03435 family)
MIRQLLIDRFDLKYHTEKREVSAYSLVAPKPRLKSADPASRTFCGGLMRPPAGSPPGSWLITCQNVTMAQLADRLQGMGPGIYWPIEDATNIEGRWDISLTFLLNQTSENTGGVGQEQAAELHGGLTIFEALEKLGLKLEKWKRVVEMVVVDHLEQKPSGN